MRVINSLDKYGLLKLVAEKPYKKNFSPNEALKFRQKVKGNKLPKDTLLVYLNNRLIINKEIKNNNTIAVPLAQAHFGENDISFKLKNDESFNHSMIVEVIPSEAPIKLTYTILGTYEHNPKDFTQGLILEGDTIIESTGGYGSSVLKKYNYKSGTLYKELILPNKYFGEGITILNGKLYQLTYKERKIFVYDAASFEAITEINFSSEGWGITNDSQYLIISNGTSTLYYLDPQSYEIVKQIKVFDNDGEVNKINELEFINGEIYANIWLKDKIIIIEPSSGVVTKILDFKDLVKNYKNGILSENVLNGIAHDPSTGKLLITGKKWPVLFEIQVQEDRIAK